MNYWLESKSKREELLKKGKDVDRERHDEIPLWKIIKKSSKKLPGKSPK